MRRHLLHIAVALLAFTVGFIADGRYEHLAYALSLSALVFILAKAAPALDVDLHFVCVVAMSFLFWFAGVLALLAMLPAYNTCIVKFNDEVIATPTGADDDARTDVSGEKSGESLSGVTIYTCVGYSTSADTATQNSIWAGLIDGKAIAKPAPTYAPLARQSRVGGTVAVAVIVDQSGKVTQAQVLSGHTLLRQAALEAACRARFSPSHIDGIPLRVSGILTYRFGL